MIRFGEKTDLAINFQNLRRRASVRSAIQQIDLYQHPTLGKILVLNDEVQHVEKWQSLYHEPLIHLPSAFVPELRDVLILGGGSLFAAFEALRYPTVKNCTLVDHDPMVIDVMAQHYPHATKVIQDPRFNHVSSNAVTFLENTKNKYDLVINDGFDSVRIASESGQSVFDLMGRRLAASGVCADVFYRHIFDGKHIEKGRGAFRKKKHAISLVTVPEYPGILHLLVCWGSERVSQTLRSPINSFQKRWTAKRSTAPKLQFYDPRFLSFYLYLPPYLKQL
jgi:spermidine synthase